MAMNDWRRQYWDSTLFLTYLEDAAAYQERVGVVAQLLDQQNLRRFEIVVSTLVVAEIRPKADPNVPGPAPGEESATTAIRFNEQHWQAIRELMDSDQLIYRPVSVFIAERAAEIGKQYPKLTPADAVHIATALESEADVLFTYDGAGQRRRPHNMLRYDGMIDGLPIKEPQVTGQAALPG